MQGISQSKHQHLVDALLHLEKLLVRDFEANADLQQAAEYRGELDRMHRDYDRLLSELSEVIADYQELFCKVKIQFLSRKLKELKKEIPIEKPAFLTLVDNIRLAYGT